MKQRNLKLMDIRELLIQIRAQSSDRQVARDTGHHRSTVKRYRDWAQSQGLLEGEMPPLEELQQRVTTNLPERTPPQNQSSVEAYREPIEKWVKANVEVEPYANVSVREATQAATLRSGALCRS